MRQGLEPPRGGLHLSVPDDRRGGSRPVRGQGPSSTAKRSCSRDDGRSDFEALMPKAAGRRPRCGLRPSRLDGGDLRLRPIEERRSALVRLGAGVNGILFSQALSAEDAVVFKKACELNLEGIVSKRESSCFYKSGPSRNWLKTINPDFVRT